jgi:serine/threonine protein phosphatase PrpC
MEQPTAAIWGHCLDCAALTDIGLRRANNQDSYALVLAGDQADFQQRGHFFMVADGMGAHAAGELASKMATDVVSLAYRKLLDQSPPEALLSAILDANRQVHVRGQASPDFRGMGTTATALVLLPLGALVAHVGDSRAYRLRGNRIEQLTFDHSLVWEMRASGQLPANEVPGYISKNIITRSLGPNPAVQIDLEGPYPLQAEDTFLICCDGLSNPVKDEEIGMVLGCLPPAEAVRALIDLACLRGGPDNITAVVVRVLGPQVLQGEAVEHIHRSPPANHRPVHPLIWTLLGVASLGAVGLFVLGDPWAALASFVGATAAALAAFWQRYGGLKRRPDMDNRRFGRGPYVAADAAPTPELLSRLAEIVRQLRDAALSENWQVDWNGFDGLLAQAAAAMRAGNLVEAARGHLRAISSVMSQLRKQRTASSDSGVFNL